MEKIVLSKNNNMFSLKKNKYSKTAVGSIGKEYLCCYLKMVNVCLYHEEF